METEQSGTGQKSLDVAVSYQFVFKKIYTTRKSEEERGDEVEREASAVRGFRRQKKSGADVLNTPVTKNADPQSALPPSRGNLEWLLKSKLGSPQSSKPKLEEPFGPAQKVLGSERRSPVKKMDTHGGSSERLIFGRATPPNHRDRDANITTPRIPVEILSALESLIESADAIQLRKMYDRIVSALGVQAPGFGFQSTVQLAGGNPSFPKSEKKRQAESDAAASKDGPIRHQSFLPIATGFPPNSPILIRSQTKPPVVDPPAQHRGLLISTPLSPPSKAAVNFSKIRSMKNELLLKKNRQMIDISLLNNCLIAQNVIKSSSKTPMGVRGSFKMVKGLALQPELPLFKEVVGSVGKGTEVLDRKPLGRKGSLLQEMTIRPKLELLTSRMEEDRPVLRPAATTVSSANKLNPIFLSHQQSLQAKAPLKGTPLYESVKSYLQANGASEALNSHIGEQVVRQFLTKHSSCLPECVHLDSLLATLVKRKAQPLAEIKINV